MKGSNRNPSQYFFLIHLKVSSKEFNNKLDELQSTLKNRADLVLAMKIIHKAEKFNAEQYYACAKEYKKLDIRTRQLELEIIGLY